ncbi:ATP-binding protein [Blastococcus sp. CCUG 61487]|uniref:ATP-binding protein n=1 Tax=Blastococcus sp. CCUG 61487 TaxID=1840703 RepID=UPI0010C10DF3|nr:ATP-binding protein [Blastococcus sp. CCUG 61487]TKJ22845.1 histidine kinase [Blastococcus sp. CCUG 61487]
MGRRLSWPVRPLPDERGETWRWTLGDLAELPAARSALRNRLLASGIGPGGLEDSGERLVLAFDELASNALRHGEPPVVATVSPVSDGWLLAVCDHAPDEQPTPAVDRDPAHGGMGLHMVARLAVAHGWYVQGGAKHVWACLPTEAEGQEQISA